METQYEPLVILEIQNVLIQEIDGKSQKVLQQGSLHVLEIKQYGLTFLKLNQFQYTLQKNIPVITQQVQSTDGGVPLNMFVLPSADHLFYGIIIEQSQIELSHLFELVMADKCQLVQPSDQNIQLFAPQKHNLNDSTHQEILMKNTGVVLVQTEQVHEKIQAQSSGWQKAGPPKSNGQQSTIPGKIVKVGDACKEGIMSGAKFISQGLISGGQYCQSKITHKETRHIDQVTIDRLKKVNSGSKAVYKYTKEQVELLVKLGSVNNIIPMNQLIGDSASNSIGQSEAGQAIKQNQIYKDVKEVGKSTIYVFASIYDGLFDALGVLGDGVALATTELVNAKYGEEAGLVSRQSFELAGSVGHLVRVHEDATIKAIIKDSKT